jgi:hypothetical protein
VHETVLKDRLNDRAATVGDGVERGELGLHVRREGGIRCGADVHAFGTFAVHFQLDPIRPGIDLCTGFVQFLQYCVQ